MTRPGTTSARLTAAPPPSVRVRAPGKVNLSLRVGPLDSEVETSRSGEQAHHREPLTHLPPQSFMPARPVIPWTWRV